MKTILKYFFQGIILLIPLSITLVILFKLFDFFSSFLSLIGLTGNYYLDTLIGLAILVTFVTMTGILASSFLFKNIFNYFEDKLEHAPVIKHIYSPVKDFMNAFSGNKKSFNKPVLVLTNPQANIEEIGFITHDDLTELGIKDKVAVYLPYSYSFSGKTVIVSRDQIKPLNIEGGNAMKFVLTGGVTDVDN
jgi:uncharacterized membrane protein